MILRMLRRRYTRSTNKWPREPLGNGARGSIGDVSLIVITAITVKNRPKDMLAIYFPAY